VKKQYFLTFFRFLLRESLYRKKSIDSRARPWHDSMSEFNPTPFKGEPGVPHVPEDWFTTLFVSTQVHEGGKKRGERMLSRAKSKPPSPPTFFLPPSLTLPSPSLSTPNSTQLAVLVNMFPGRIAGIQVRPNRIK